MIRGLLTVDPKRRLKLVDIYSHPWLVTYRIPASIPVLDSLVPFASRDYENLIHISAQSVLGREAQRLREKESSLSPFLDVNNPNNYQLQIFNRTANNTSSNISNNLPTDESLGFYPNENIRSAAGDPNEESNDKRIVPFNLAFKSGYQIPQPMYYSPTLLHCNQPIPIPSPYPSYDPRYPTAAYWWCPNQAQTPIPYILPAPCSSVLQMASSDNQAQQQPQTFNSDDQSNTHKHPDLCMASLADVTGPEVTEIKPETGFIRRVHPPIDRNPTAPEQAATQINSRNTTAAAETVGATTAAEVAGGPQALPTPVRMNEDSVESIRRSNSRGPQTRRVSCNESDYENNNNTNQSLADFPFDGVSKPAPGFGKGESAKTAEIIFNFNELLELQIYIIRKFHWAFIGLRKCPTVSK